MKKVYDASSELLAKALIECLKNEGYRVVRYTDSKKHSMSSSSDIIYDCLEIKNDGDEYFNLSIGKHTDFKHPHENRMVLASETFESISFEILNSIPVADWSVSSGEIEYIFIEDTEKNRKKIIKLGANDEDLKQMELEDGKGLLDITTFAFEKMKADRWSKNEGFTTD